MLALAALAALAAGDGRAEAPAPDPLVVFENPPPSAKTGVWWHWMGCNVTREGIVRDLDWFRRVPDTRYFYHDYHELLENPEAYARMAKAVNPYGDGHACERILDAIAYYFGQTDVRPDEFR